MSRAPTLDSGALAPDTLQPEAFRRAERAHYRLLSALYLRERRDLAGLSLFHAPGIPEPEWNHAGLIALESCQLEPKLPAIRAFYEQRSLPTTISVSPFTEPPDLTRRLGDLGFEPSFRHSWLFATPAAPRTVRLPEGVEIRRLEETGALQDGIAVFEAVYSTAEWGESLPPGYARALRDSLISPTSDVRVVHYLATADGTPAGFATSVHHEEFCGLYNLAVLPAFQRRGLGRALTRRRVADALGQGRRLIFAQTERPAVERWQRRHHFTKGFETIGYTAA